MTALQLTAVGGLTGVIIPEEILARPKVAKGDSLYLVEAPDGSFRLTPRDLSFARKMALAACAAFLRAHAAPR
ncbi:hypothetical protein CCR94_20245 [Rhodoblastus sphagnicola]|uniref:SpoVT-AbrB domain-containing protein n=1 Tax=Rhodoblastus sphagnicola TaxID=333368 RepID=A0A2S6MYI3_9HYPH|nr:AbrB/MazE/SpoVT family DNA-binding domain-containing protein [Rhodoblastus sphagnicola]MBB4199432.1 antitoxin component of MazEF toxin-antitoxin module [Rhodoblastus sphagnicola]PPQ27409.1 hypothetical protein CCR94_20245 [Rhodoblastus sphagnicola]